MVGFAEIIIMFVVVVVFGLMLVAGLLLIAAKRPAVLVVGAMLGLLLLVVAGMSIAGLVVVGQVAGVRATERSGVNTYPDELKVGALPSPAPMLSQQATISPQPVMPPPVMVPSEHSSTSYHTTWRIAFVPFVLVLGLFAVVVVGVIRQLFRKRQECGRSGWGARASIAAIIGVPLFFLLFRLGIYPVQTYVPHAVEVPLQGDHAFSESMSRAMQTQADAAERIREHQQRVAEMNRQYANAGSKLAHMREEQLATMQRQKIASAEAAQEEAARRLAAINSQLKHFIATVDINELIAMFEAPEIELPPVSPEAQAITAPAMVAISSSSASPPLAAIAVAAAATDAAAPNTIAVVDSNGAAASASAGGNSKAVVAENGESSTTEGTVAIAKNGTRADESHAAEPSEPASDTADAGHLEEHTASADPVHKPSTAADEPREHSHDQAAAAASVGDSSNHPHGSTTHSEHDPLPHWARDPNSVSADSSHQMIATDEYATTAECRRATDIYLMLKTAERVHAIGGRQYFAEERPSLTFHGSAVWADGQMLLDARSGNSHDYRMNVLQRMGIGIDQIRRAIVRDQHIASRESPRSFGTMYTQYTLVEFTPEFDKELRRHWHTYRRGERFAVIGVGTASVLGLLTLVFGLLKIDTWTKGYYTKRLFLGVPAAIIGGIVLIGSVGGYFLNLIF